MRLSVPTPTADPLPYASHDGKLDADSSRPKVPLRADAVARFDALLHELNPDAARVDPDRMQHLIHWLLTLPEPTAHGVLDARLRRIDELRALLADPDWDADAAMQARLQKLLGYIDRDEHLVVGHESMLGRLDDVLLIELAWPAFAQEVDEYRDFCAYRQDEHPPGSAVAQRAAWVRDGLAEIALWQHRLRVNDSHYIYRGHPEELFRVA